MMATATKIKWRNDEWTRRAKAIATYLTPESSVANPRTLSQGGSGGDCKVADHYFGSLPLRSMP